MDYDLPDFSFDCITYDSYNMFAHCVEFLVGLGRKKILFIGVDIEHKDKHMRLAGYKYGMSKTGMSDNDKMFFAKNFSFDGGYYIVDEILGKINFDAVICHNDEIALGFMERLKSRGVKIPDDVMVIGFNDMPQASSVKPSLTTVRVDTQGIGYLSAQIINARLENIFDAPVMVNFGLEIIKRESTGIYI